MLSCLLVLASEEDHSNRDCFAVAVLTHGDNGVLYGKDRTIAIENFINPIKNCTSLDGKPKIFIIQVGSACMLSVVMCGTGIVILFLFGFWKKIRIRFRYCVYLLRM